MTLAPLLAPVRAHARLTRVVVLAVGLASGVLAVYAVAVLGGPHRMGPWRWLGATAVVAVLVPLTRPWLDRVADRLAYGPTEDPRAVLADFVRRLADELAVDDVLPELARTAARATHSSWGEVRLWLADGAEWRRTWPPGSDGDRAEVSVSLRHSGEVLGRLDLGRQDEQAGRAREALDRLAGSAGVALSNVRLTVELRRRLAQTTELADQLQHSRQRLLDAAEAQRQQLTLRVQRVVLDRLSTVEQHLATTAGDPSGLRAALEETTAALEGLRHVAAGIYPPVLQQRGLAGALDWHLDHQPVAVSTEIRSEQDLRQPAALEAAAYFCCVALLDDCPAGTRPRLTIDSGPTTLALRLQLAQPPRPAVLELVRDRIEALGGAMSSRPGGTCHLVTVDLPTRGAPTGPGSAEGSLP